MQVFGIRFWKFPYPMGTISVLPRYPCWSTRDAYSIGTGNQDLHRKAFELTSPSQPMGTSAGALTQRKLPLMNSLCQEGCSHQKNPLGICN